jgi:hypothetical protein
MHKTATQQYDQYIYSFTDTGILSSHVGSKMGEAKLLFNQQKTRPDGDPGGTKTNANRCLSIFNNAFY